VPRSASVLRSLATKDESQSSNGCSESQSGYTGIEARISRIIWILVDLATNFVKNTSDYCNSRKILILLWNRKAWLRSQALYPPLAD